MDCFAVLAMTKNAFGHCERCADSQNWVDKHLLAYNFAHICWNALH